jgi:hypothetical protein
MVDAFIIAIAVATLVAVERRPRPVRPATAVLLALLTGAWLWANLRTSGWQEEMDLPVAGGLDPITKAMFWRGWPLAPCMICIIHGMKFHPSGEEGLVLVFDWVVLVVALFLVKAALWLAKAVYERWFPRRDGLE